MTRAAAGCQLRTGWTSALIVPRMSIGSTAATRMPLGVRCEHGVGRAERPRGRREEISAFLVHKRLFMESSETRV